MLGAGPFEKGDIYDGTRFAGEPLNFTPKWLRDDPERTGPDPATALADYDAPRTYRFDEPEPPAVSERAIQLAAGEEPAGKLKEQEPAADAPAGGSG